MFLSGGIPFPVQAEALGETTPLYVGGNYYTQSPLSLNQRFALYTELYRRQLWVYVVCRKIAVGTARLGINVWQPGPNGKADASDSPYAQLLQRPNPRMSGAYLWLWTATTYEIHGEAIWVKLRDTSGRVRELHPMHPMNTVVRRDPDEDMLWYIFTSGARDHRGVLPPIPETDVIHFKAYNPDNTMRGMSQLEPLRSTLESEDAIRRASDSFWKRGARPSMVLSHPGTLSKPAADRLRASWEARHAGADSMGGTAVLEEGMTATPVQLSAEEMQYIESRKLNREEVCAAADIPPPVVHILDNATYSNITEQMRSMYRDTMAPRLGLYEAELDTHLAPEFDASLQARFNLDQVLRGDFESRSQAVVPLVTNGVMKPQEARPLFDLPKLADPEADLLYANQAMQPLGRPPGTTNITAQAEATNNLLQALGDGPDALAGAPQPPAPGAPTGAPPAPAGKALAVGRDQLVAHTRDQLDRAFRAQHQAAALAAGTGGALAGLKAAGQDPAAVFDPAVWNDQLAGILAQTGAVAAQVYAQKVGARYDPQVVQQQVADQAPADARRINAATLAQLGAAMASGLTAAEAVTKVFGALTGDGGRLQQIAATRVTRVGNQAAETAAKTGGMRSKTWRTGPHPRPTHAAVDGETVPVGAVFSNGLAFPGDASEGPEESAGCNCSLEYGREEPP